MEAGIWPGSWVFWLAMSPIITCAVVACAFVMERLWMLRPSRVLPEDLIIEMNDLVAQSRYPDALTICRKDGSPLARILHTVIENAGKKRSFIKEKVEEVGRREAAGLERFTGALATISVISPLFGLLGTVVGMLLIFKQVSGSDSLSTPQLLAGGIGTALYTTVFGLVVAIPSLVFHRYLQSRIDALLLEMEAVSLDFVEKVKGEED